MIHILDNHGTKILGYLDLSDDLIYWDDNVDRDVSGKGILEFKMLSSSRVAQYMQDKNRLLIPHEREGYQEFVIYETEISDNEIQIYAVASGSSLNERKVINPGTFEGYTLRQYTNLALSGTEFLAGKIESNIIRTLTFEEHIQPNDFLNRLQSPFEVELVERIEVEGNKVYRFIDFLKAQGRQYTGKEFVNEKDIQNITKSIYNERIVTKLVCLGPEREDGTRHVVEVEDKDAFQRWNFRNQHIVKLYEPETEDMDMTIERLTQLGNMELKKRINSAVEYQMTVADLGAVFGYEAAYLGDSVRIKDEDFNPPFYAEARIINVSGPIKRINDSRPLEKTFTIGEVVEYSEDEVFRTFRAIQRNYGFKIIKSDTPPTGRANTIWKQPGELFDIPHTFNFETNEWQKMTATDAEEIGGLLIGKQYNGVSFSPERGIVSDRTDGLVETFMNATDGFGINSRETDTDEFKPVFFVDEFGNLTFAGVMKGANAYFGGENNQDGILIVSGADGAPVAEINAAEGRYYFPQLDVGDLIAPNVVSYADYRNENRKIYVANESASGISEPSDDNTGESWSRPLNTIGEALRRIPTMFKGTVEILCAFGQTFNEDIEISGFGGGGTLIIRNSAETTRSKVSGSVRIVSNQNFIEWRDINLDSTDPYAGFFIRGSHGLLSNVNINGAAGETSNAVNVNSGASFEFYNARPFNCSTYIRASYGGVAYAFNNEGQVSGVTFIGFGGGKIAGSGTAPTGASNTSEIQGGQVTGSWTFPAPPAPPSSPAPVTTKKTWNANSDSGTWRADFGGRWEDISPYGGFATQGSYAGYGPFTGAFFFGSNLSSTVNGKTIKSIRVYCERVSGGNGGSVTIKFRPHTSNSRPSGNISLQSPEGKAGFAVGEKKWITLPKSFHAGFANGTYKGIGIYSGSTSYAKLRETAKIEITYE